MQLSDINLLDQDRFTHGIPHEWFTYLRREAPVYLHPEPDGPGFWVVTKHADVVAVGRDGTTFSSAQARGGVIGLDGPTENPEVDPGGNLMLMMDAPEHTRYRKLVNYGFTPRRVAALEPHIRQLTNQTLDEVIEAGECDFVVDVAAELPLQVIAEMLGVPLEDRHKIFEWSNRMVGSDDPEYIVPDTEVEAAQVEMFMYANELAQQRRANPRDDIVTALLDAEVDGDRLSEMDFNMFFMLLSVAGNETTRNSISHGMRAFLENPDQYQALVDDPSLSASATEEIVRWASPVMYFRRNTTRDTEIRGQEIPAGEKVSIWYVSANRDEDIFDDPFRFDIRRDPNDHIGFGGGGPHHCLGANLARMEIRVLFEELARRVPKIEPAGETQHLRSNFIGGIKHLPVQFTPGTRARDRLMDFTFDDTQRDLRDLGRKILDEQITTERLKELEEAGEPYDRRCWTDLADTNLLGVALPEDVGGSGYGLMELCVLLEEVGRHVAPVPLLATLGAALPIAELGSADQRSRFLPPVVAGRSILTAALQEPGHADPLAPTTTATADGDGWRLDGEKLGVPYAPLADAILVPASTGDRSAAVFVVTPDADGLSIEPATATNGEPQGHLTLTGVRVEASDALGDHNAPNADALEWIHGRALAGLCATAVGVFEKALRITAGYISERKQFERPIATFQGATLRAADAYIDTEAIRVTAWSAIWRLAAGRDARDELAIAKFWVADGGQRVAHACQHLHGGIGATTDYPIHRYFIWAKWLEHTLGGAPEQLLHLGDSVAAGRG